MAGPPRAAGRHRPAPAHPRRPGGPRAHRRGGLGHTGHAVPRRPPPPPARHTRLRTAVPGRRRRRGDPRTVLRHRRPLLPRTGPRRAGRLPRHHTACRQRTRLPDRLPRRRGAGPARPAGRRERPVAAAGRLGRAAPAGVHRRVRPPPRPVPPRPGPRHLDTGAHTGVGDERPDPRRPGRRPDLRPRQAARAGGDRSAHRHRRTRRVRRDATAAGPARVPAAADPRHGRRRRQLGVPARPGPAPRHRRPLPRRPLQELERMVLAVEPVALRGLRLRRRPRRTAAEPRLPRRRPYRLAPVARRHRRRRRRPGRGGPRQGRPAGLPRSPSWAAASAATSP